MSWEFVVTATVVCLLPGTGALYTLGSGLAHGSGRGLLAAFACTLGTLPHLAAAVTGLAALLHASGVAFAVLKYAGVCYLLWMAWTTWHDEGTLALASDETPARRRSVILTGVTINLLNPKLTVFFVAFLPQFLPAGGSSHLGRMLVLGGVFMVLTFITFAIYAVAAAALRDRVLVRPRVVRTLRRIFAVTFVALGARLAVERR